VPALHPGNPTIDGEFGPFACESFHNKFRKLGFVDYDGGALRVNSGLPTVVLLTTLVPKAR